MVYLSLVHIKLGDDDMKRPSDNMNWRKAPTDWRILTAFSECPGCETQVMLQPMPGYFALCPGCDEVVTVFVLPLILEKGKNCCVLQACLKDGRGRLLHTPGFFEFGEWVL